MYTDERLYGGFVTADVYTVFLYQEQNILNAKNDI